MDKIELIVERAIAYTESILLRAPHHIGAAREGLERMRENLARGAPGHPALARLEAFIRDLDNQTGPGALH